MSQIYDFKPKNILGKEVELNAYIGKVLLIVNTASKCGFTPQYDGLEELYQSRQGKGLEILAFPCNQFKEQEKGSDSEIADFCRLNHGVTFDLFSKIDVNGENAAPLYRYLKEQAPGLLGSQAIKWNFTKFLVNREGKVLKRYASIKKPMDIAADIDKLL